MKTFLEWKRTKHTKTITITCRDQDDTLEEMLRYMKAIGNSGHTFNIIMDDGHKKFEWDGDGNDAIFEIKISKQAEADLKMKFDIEGEPVEVEDTKDMNGLRNY